MRNNHINSFILLKSNTETIQSQGERAMTEFFGGSAEPKNSRLAPTRLCFILTTSFHTPSPPHPQDVLPADVATGMDALLCLPLFKLDAIDPQMPVPR
jgi:hypothetical protein